MVIQGYSNQTHVLCIGQPWKDRDTAQNCSSLLLQLLGSGTSFQYMFGLRTSEQADPSENCKTGSTMTTNITYNTWHICPENQIHWALETLQILTLR